MSIVDSEGAFTFSAGTAGTTAATFTANVSADTTTTVVITFATAYGSFEYVVDVDVVDVP